MKQETEFHYKCSLVSWFCLMLYLSEENAERIMLDPTSRENLKFKDLLKVDIVISPQHSQSSKSTKKCVHWRGRFHCILMWSQVLIDWINSELEEERIIVKDLEEDCYDGQVLQKLFGEKLNFYLFTFLGSQLSQHLYPSTLRWPSTVICQYKDGLSFV